MSALGSESTGQEGRRFIMVQYDYLRTDKWCAIDLLEAWGGGSSL